MSKIHRAIIQVDCNAPGSDQSLIKICRDIERFANVALQKGHKEIQIIWVNQFAVVEVDGNHAIHATSFEASSEERDKEFKEFLKTAKVPVVGVATSIICAQPG